MKTKGKRIAIAAGMLAVAVLCIAVWVGWPSLRFYYLFAPLGVNAQGFREYRHRQTGIVMAALPGGTFWMGAQKTDPKGPNYDPEAEDNEGPLHEVTLSPFLISKYETTQAEWKAVMGSNPSKFRGDDNRPVEQVSWSDIQGFQAKTGLRLPSEAEWEYACSGGATAPIAGAVKLDEMGWYSGNSGRTTHPVGKKSANGFGLHDMYGNVWEWSEDVLDNRLAWEGQHRSARGGSWADEPRLCRSSLRGGAFPTDSHEALGFRPVYYPVP